MNRPPISRRMSKRLAALATSTSLTSWSGSAGGFGSVIVGFSSALDEDEVQGDDAGDDAAAEQPRGTPPQLVARVDVGLVVALGHAPDQAVELGDRFRLG